MAWPTDDIVTSNLDSSTDSAASARANLYTALIRIKEIIAGRNTASGVCPLDAGSKVPVANIPSLSYLPSTGGTVSGATTFSAGLTSNGAVGINTGGLGVMGGITVTTGNISITAGSGTAIKSSQTGYSSAGLQSQSATGNAGIGLHCAGSSAAYIEHVRGGSGIRVFDYAGAYANFAAGQVNAGAAYTSYCYLNADATNSILALDNNDYFAWNRSTNTLSFVVGATPSIVMSALGIYPQTDNNNTVCGASNLRWTSAYAINVGYTNLINQSDKRLKDHQRWVSDEEAGRIIDGLRPAWFKWKEDGRLDCSFYAQDMAEVVPVATAPPTGEREWWGTRPDRLIPFLVTEIQSLRRRLAALEAAQ